MSTIVWKFEQLRRKLRCAVLGHFPEAYVPSYVARQWPATIAKGKVGRAFCVYCTRYIWVRRLREQ